MSATNRTVLGIPSPDFHDEPTVYLNPGQKGAPFAVVDLGPQMAVYLHEAAHARVIAAVFTKAADLLDTIPPAEGSPE